MDEIPPNRYHKSGYPLPGGGWAAESTPRKPRRRRKATPPAQDPQPPPRSGYSGLAITLTVAAVLTIAIGAITVTATVGSGAKRDRTLSVQVKANLNQIATDLATLGFRAIRSITPAPEPSYSTNCAGSATGGVRQFLTRHPCKEYATATLITHKRGNKAKVAITWVVMPTKALARQYKHQAGKPGGGNPPGQPPAFNGLCYASGQNGPTVWAEQVQTTGPLSLHAKRKILQSAALRKLSREYLQVHCTQ